MQARALKPRTASKSKGFSPKPSMEVAIGKYWLLLNLLLVRNYLKDKEYDALHCHDFDGLFVGSKICNASKGIKLIYDEHDLFYQYFMNRPGPVNRFIYNYIIKKEKEILEKVHTHIVVTSNMASLYSNSNNIVVINNAPYKNMFKDNKKHDRDKPVIGFIGGVRHYKELKLLIDVSAEFEKEIDIIIAGRGVGLERVEKYCGLRNNKNVSITGGFEMAELEKLYKNIDVAYLIYPRTAIVSMPNKFFESIVTETPIIADVNTEFGQIVKKKGLVSLLIQILICNHS